MKFLIRIERGELVREIGHGGEEEGPSVEADEVGVNVVWVETPYGKEGLDVGQGECSMESGRICDTEIGAEPVQ